MNYTVMVKMKVNKPEGKTQACQNLHSMFQDWMEDPKLKMIRIFREEDPIEMLHDADGLMRFLRQSREVEFIAKGEQSEVTKSVWSYLMDPERIEEGILSYRASLNREDKEVRLISGVKGKCQVFDTSINGGLKKGYDPDMPVQLTQHSLRVSGVNGDKLSEVLIQNLEELRQLSGGELTVNDHSAKVTFESKFMMPEEKEALYMQMNLLSQEVVGLEMEPLALLAEDAFYCELVQFENRKLRIYSISI